VEVREKEMARQKVSHKWRVCVCVCVCVWLRAARVLCTRACQLHVDLVRAFE
jgi:hypothetical protein